MKFEILFSDLVSGEECYSDTLEIFDGTVKNFLLLIECTFKSITGAFA